MLYLNRSVDCHYLAINFAHIELNGLTRLHSHGFVKLISIIDPETEPGRPFLDIVRSFSRLNPSIFSSLTTTIRQELECYFARADILTELDIVNLIISRVGIANVVVTSACHIAKVCIGDLTSCG